MTEVLVRPSRRSFVRAAAWSVPVVSVAATAPAFALTTAGTIGSVPGSAVSYNASSRRHVAWDLSLVNGAVAIQSISIKLTYVPDSGNLNYSAFEVYGYQESVASRDTTWQTTLTGAATATVTHLGLAARSTTLVHTDYTASNNSSGIGTVYAVATITYVNGTQSTSNANATWVDGQVAHSHL